MAEADDLRVVIFVMDTGPLLTLAAAEALDYLKLPSVPVFIPDGVFYEATVNFSALGAQDILSWVQENRNAVSIVPTSVFAEAQALAALRPPEGPTRMRDMGERAALELVSVRLREAPANERAVLVAEDAGALARATLDPWTLPLHMSAFLAELEAQGRINSAEEVYRRAEDAGRYAARLERSRVDHARGMDAVRRAIGGRGNGAD